jgi:hypothetical protein
MSDSSEWISGMSWASTAMGSGVRVPGVKRGVQLAGWGRFRGAVLWKITACFCGSYMPEKYEELEQVSCICTYLSL